MAEQTRPEWPTPGKRKVNAEAYNRWEREHASPAASATVKTTIRLPEPLWRAARVRALDEHADFQDIVARALEMYLKTTPKRRETGR